MFDKKLALESASKYFSLKSRVVIDVDSLEDGFRKSLMERVHLIADGYFESLYNANLIRMPKDICLVFEESIVANCQAITLGEREDVIVIVITSAMLEIISDVFFTFASNSSIPLHQQYDSDGVIENETVKFISRFSTEYLSRNKLESSLAHMKFDNEMSEVTFDILLDFAFSFMVLHEIGHALHGHRRKNSPLDTGFLEFQYNDDGTVPGGLWEQTLEMDADSFASNGMMQRIVNLLKRERISDSWMSAILNRERVFYYYGVSIHLLFNVMAVWSGFPLISNPEMAMERSHPPVYFRHRYSFKCGIEQVLCREAPEFLLLSFKMYSLAFRDVEFLWCNYFESNELEFNNVLMEQQSSEYFDRYLKILNEHWSEHVRNDLLGRTFRELPE